MTVDGAVLLKDLKPWVGRLEDDLRRRCEQEAGFDDALRGEWTQAHAAGRTAQTYESWRDAQLTQVAVAWILGCVFVRFCEDNGLIDDPRLAGPGSRLALAKDNVAVFFRHHPEQTEREYLLDVFETAATLPGLSGIFDRRHNPLWQLGPTGDQARALLQFWQEIDPDTGDLRRDFTDPEWNTRFLGDLYQDLSDDAKKRYALLQTPEFVEEFILDRTLTPAIDTFGYTAVRLIDPTCGSGHFLLGAFARLFDLRRRHEPAANPTAAAQAVLDQIYGVDINPFAVAIARFRLLVAALAAANVRSLANAPDFQSHLAAGDSLLFGKRSDRLIGMDDVRQRLTSVAYVAEDADALDDILSQHYHVVVGNPPYITVKDKALNEAYRALYRSCHRQYSLSVPFMERFFDLAIEGEQAGFVGQITANSFMKREFGKKLIEDYIPTWDLTQVIDTSGAYIPGHGTPTVILVGRHRAPVGATVRLVMGIRGEPSTPSDSTKGLVWTAIVDQLDSPGSESAFVSVADLDRDRLRTHPWSIGGGGAAELREALESSCGRRLDMAIRVIGFGAITGEDNLYLSPSPRDPERQGIKTAVRLVLGDEVRDWAVEGATTALKPYRDDWQLFTPVELRESKLEMAMWPARRVLELRKRFGIEMIERGLSWFEWRELYLDRVTVPLSIAFAFVATHNHFVLDRGGKVFKQSAPVIKLPEGATEDDHLGLLGLLNSSTACFWMKQVFHNKGDSTDSHGARVTGVDLWVNSFEHDGTKLKQFPLPSIRPLTRAKRLDALGRNLAATLPSSVASGTLIADSLESAHRRWDTLRAEMIAEHEELDWECYRLYDLIEHDLCLPTGSTPPLALGERAFEIVLARRMAAGDVETTWFERHGSTPITELPERWPADYKALVEKRIALIESDRNIGLIERPEYKRRWNTTPWDVQLHDALRTWLLDQLEATDLWSKGEPMSCARLADRVAHDADFVRLAGLYAGRPDFDLTELVTTLVTAEAVPYLAGWRYTDTGLRKRAQWEHVWDLQRAEDAIDARTTLPETEPDYLLEADAARLKAREVGDIPVPPKYNDKDFRSKTYWSLRGKLDVPKERFIAYPGAERDTDATPLVGWAGWNHLQQAQALAGVIVERSTYDGWGADKLTPLLAGLAELVPWLKQWHNDLDPAHGVRMGDYFADYLDGECRSLNLTPDSLAGWRAPAPLRGRRRRA